MNRRRLLQIALAQLVLLYGNANSRNQLRKEVSLERCVGSFSPEENALIKEALEKINKRYSINLRFSLVKSDLGKDIAGETRQDEVFIQDFSFFKPREGLWSSVYMPNPSQKQLYQRVLVHEIGHILYSSLRPSSLPRDIFSIDVINGVALKGSQTEHPAHPSFHTFFYAGFKEAEEDFDFVSRNANETFADVFALRALGFLNNPPDSLLKQKLNLIEEDIRRNYQNN